MGDTRGHGGGDTGGHWGHMVTHGDIGDTERVTHGDIVGVTHGDIGDTYGDTWWD